MSSQVQLLMPVDPVDPVEAVQALMDRVIKQGMGDLTFRVTNVETDEDLYVLDGQVMSLEELQALVAEEDAIYG